MVITREKNEATTVYFPLWDYSDGRAMKVDATFAAGDVTIMIDGGAPANSTNLPVDEGEFYSLVLTAGETNGATICIKVKDQTVPAVWYDAAIILETDPEVNVRKWNGTAVTTSATTQKPEVSAFDISDDSTAANNLEAVLDGTGGVDLRAKSLHLTNSAEAAFKAVCNGGGFAGVVIAGNSNSGLLINGGGTGAGVTINAGTSGGGAALHLSGIGGNSDALKCSPTGTGLDINGDINGFTTAGKAEIKAEVDNAFNTVDSSPTSNSRADHIRKAGQRILRRGTAQSATSNTIRLDAGAPSGTNFFEKDLLEIVEGLGAGQAEFVTAYNGTTKDCTMGDTWVVTPDGTSVFQITAGGTIPRASAPTAAQVADAVWDELLSEHTTNGTAGQGVRFVRAFVKNKHVVNRITGDITVMDDDGTTPLFTLRISEIDANTQGLIPQ